MNIKQLAGAVPGAAQAERGNGPRAALPAAPAAAAGPAVSVQLNPAAAAAGTAALGPADGLSDLELLDALKARLDAGDFEIDYGGLAQALLEDAVLAVGARRGRT